MYLTSDIWPGVYSSHQRCLEALQRINIMPRQPQSAISEAEYLRLLEYRLKTAKGEKKAEVERRLTHFNADSPLLTKGDLADKPRLIRAIDFTAKWATSEAIIFLTLIGAIAIQVHHVAQLVNRVSDDDHLWLGYLFGSVSEVTALMLTVHQVRRGMLIIFAFIQCWINLLYYCDLPNIWIKVTLSALIAFVIYAYSELFSTIQHKNTLVKPE